MGQADNNDLIDSDISKYFDEAFYRKSYCFSDTKNSALNHFIYDGWKSGFDPCSWFSVKDYLNENSDISEKEVNPFIHYLRFGKKEGRRIKPSSTIFETDGNCQTLSLEDRSNIARHSTLKNEPCPNALGNLEVCFKQYDSQSLFVGGWVLGSSNVLLWLDVAGEAFLLDDAFFYHRQDVSNAYSNTFFDTTNESGFIINIDTTVYTNGSDELDIKLYALSPSGLYKLASISSSTISSNPVKAAKALFSINTGSQTLSERFDKVDIPFLDHLIIKNSHKLSESSSKEVIFGEATDPLVSVIVPLYERYDFVEAQIQCFSNDTFFLEHVELIYVVDDPLNPNNFLHLASNLHKIYHLPFKVILSNSNRGFSGANNLGAKYASSEFLLFLNSDVFPNHTNWLSRMLDAMKSSTEIGIMAPRLLFPDGSIQHDGIEFSYREDIAIWINHHPNMGVDLEYLDSKGIKYLDAVTGACMLITKDLFFEVGSWDESYLIGDFEDTDLCMKVKSKGRKIALYQDINLTHLERQSFSTTGTADFRYKVVVFNAVKHQNKWLLEKHS